MSAGSATAEKPSRRHGASLTAAADGRSLWLVGGSDGAGSLWDVYSFQQEAGTWTKVGGRP